MRVKFRLLLKSSIWRADAAIERHGPKFGNAGANPAAPATMGAWTSRMSPLIRMSLCLKRRVAFSAYITVGLEIQ
jgi:hypothetical protein